MTREDTDDAARVATRHLRAGFGGLLVFLLLGAVLEGLFAFKVGGYLDAGNETRRLLLRLAHAHGTLVAIVNVLFALVAGRVPGRARRLASGSLLAALVLLPGGFFFGGLFVHGGDPGMAAALAPAGALALAVGIGAVAARVR